MMVLPLRLRATPSSSWFWRRSWRKRSLIWMAWVKASWRLSTPEVMRKASKPFCRARVWVTMSLTTIL